MPDEREDHDSVHGQEGVFRALVLPDEGTIFLLAVDWAGYIVVFAGFF